MSNIIELPPIEEWDSDNECLYYYGKAIEGEDGKCEVEIRITSYNVCYTKLLRDSWVMPIFIAKLS